MKYLFYFLWLFYLLPVRGEVHKNILFIISDDLATRLGCYGDKNAVTPHLDQFAKDSIVFQRAYSQGIVCTPSRTSFMLGLNGANAKPSHFLKNPETMTMGRYFRMNGYQTFSTGKVDHTEEFLDPKAWEIRANVKGMENKVTLKEIVEATGKKRQAARYAEAQDVSQLQDYFVANEAIKFFQESRDPKRPFLAVIGFYKPHEPKIALKKHYDVHELSKFIPEKIPEGVTPRGYLRDDPGLNLNEHQQKLAMRAYYAAMTGMDEQFGRIIKALKNQGLYDSTLIVFTSDHGYHLGWRGQWAKHHLDEEVMRVPLIIRHASITSAGQHTHGIVELLDLFPTFIDFAGLNKLGSLDGKSFLPILKDPSAKGKAASFCHGGKIGRTVRTQTWRLIERRDGSLELYHRPVQTREHFNVASNPEYKPVIQEHLKLLYQELGPLLLKR